jgi:hypothetical protein
MYINLLRNIMSYKIVLEHKTHKKYPLFNYLIILYIIYLGNKNN